MSPIVKYGKLYGIEIISVVLLILGIILASVSKHTAGGDIGQAVQYRDCLDIDDLPCSNETTPRPCYCSEIILNNTETVEGPVTLYYELRTFDQTRKGYVDSRDDDQFLGHLSKTPSASCGDYRFDGDGDNKKPIAPCGAIADSMFTDNYQLTCNRKYVPMIMTGLFTETEKKSYQNPPGSNLSSAFKDFAKPKSWNKNIWELDENDPNNNGFQKESFIAWMRTDLKRKPIARVNHTGIYANGLPPGVYAVQINYNYPISRYDGERIVILNNAHIETNRTSLGFGIAFIIIGLVAFVAKVIYNKKKYDGFIPVLTKSNETG